VHYLKLQSIHTHKSAEHGQDLAAQAQEFLTGGKKTKGKRKEKEKKCDEEVMRP